MVGVVWLISARTGGWRLSAWSLAASMILLGAASGAYPDYVSSLGRTGGALAVAWGAAVIVAAEPDHRRDRTRGTMTGDDFRRAEQAPWDVHRFNPAGRAVYAPEVLAHGATGRSDDDCGKASGRGPRLFDRLLEASPATGRHVELASRRQAHVIEAGTGDPLVMVHPGGTSALLFLPLIARLTGLRAMAVDRPGFGLSDPIDFTRDSFRSGVVSWMSQVLDALGLNETALLGSSMGGTWSLWYALEHPERVRRLVLVGAVPMAPGARLPAPLRLLFGLMISPGVGPLVSRMVKPSKKSVVQMMSFFGEGETVVDYPEQIDVQVAAGSDPVVAQANLAEMRAVGTALGGVRREFRLRPDELARLNVPTLIVWGEHDPIGDPSVARALADAIPGARLELLPTAHMPWFAEPDRTGELVDSFVREPDPSGRPV